MLSKTCLICSKESICKNNQTDSEYIVEVNFSDPNVNSHGHNKADKENENMQNQVHVIFLLRKLLEIPEDTCCLLLQHFGNPNLWIECCDDCSNLVQKCHTAFRQIISLQKYYEDLRLDIKNTILKSQKTNAKIESKCEAIVRSYIITQDVARYIKSGTQTQNKKSTHSGNHFELNNSLEMSSNYFGREQSTTGCCGPPLGISNCNKLRFNSDKDNPVPFTETITDADAFFNSSTTTEKNTESVCSESDTVAKVDLADLEHSLISANCFVNPQPYICGAPVLLNEINNVKCEVENQIPLNVVTEDDEMICSTLKSSGFLQNIVQPNNEFQKSNDKRNNGDQTTQDTKNAIHLLSNNSVEDSSSVDSHSYILPDDNFETYSGKDTLCQVGTSAQSNTRDENNTIEMETKEMTQRKHKEKQFECDICRKKFQNKYKLERHRNSHTGEKRYICKFCGWSCTDNSSLVRHERIHTREEPFFCDICGKSFVQKQTYEIHRRLHTGEKPYACDICGNSFRVRQSLTKHLKSHT